MAPAAEDVLGELYAWDSVIEDDSSMSADDPHRDEDKTEDAYEQIIHTASGDASDIVLSLAAQLLHKHFFRFPHVQINVIEVLLKLCGPKRSQAVRIHTLRALLQIAKTPPATAAASTPTSAASIARKNTRTWLQHIYEAVQHMLESEKSSVILRQVTPLRQALEERLLPEYDEQPNKDKTSDHGNMGDCNDNKQTSEISPSELNRKNPRNVMDAANSEENASSEPDPKKAKYDDETEYQAVTNTKEGKIVQLNRDASNVEASCMDLWKKPLSNSRLNENEGRRSKVNAFSPRNCPPCPYLFLGSVPRHTPNAEIVEFLTPVWPAIDSMSVQIKQPDHNATAYAFVSMPSIEHAREAIHYVAANKFRGRTSLNANFARGPPVDTVLFVERTAEDVNMEDKGAVREFDFTKCDPDVWNILCQQLERFGPLDFAENGCVRFRSSEHAKAVIRKQIFSVKGYEIYPVYDTKEQFAIDSTRRGPNTQSKQGFTLKSGRLVGGDSDYPGSKRYYSKVDDDTMNSRREPDRLMSLKYAEHSRSPLRSDRGSARGRSPSYSPKLRSRGRYDGPISGFSKERRHPHSRSRSPLTITKKSMMFERGYGTPPDKENHREFHSKGGRRSYSPVTVKNHDSSVLEKMRGRPREREGPWINARSIGDVREPRQPKEGQLRGKFRGASPSPSSSSRRSRKDDRGSQRSVDYRCGGGSNEDVRKTYCREDSLQEDRGRTHPLCGGLGRSRSRSHSPLKYGKFAGKNRPRSRSRSVIAEDMRKGSAYRGRDEHSFGPSDDRPSVQTERPRYADNRSIAEVARDEQQERQRYFLQQHVRRDVSDSDLSRYGAGRGGGRVGGRGRGDRHQPQQPYKGNRGGAMCRYDLPPSRGRSRSPPPPSTRQRSVSPPSRTHQRSFSPEQPRKSYSRESRREIAPRGHESAYSPPPPPVFQSLYGPGPAGPSDHELDPEVDERWDRESSRHERRHHSNRGRDDKGRRSRRDHQEIHLTRPDPSRSQSPVHREHISVSSGRKSNGHSPRRSFHRRMEGDNQSEEVSGTEKQTRLKNEDESHSQDKEIQNGGPRLARDELFAGMDDLTVDYEEDD